MSACKICIYLYDNIFVIITLDFFSLFICHNISPKYCLLVVQSLNLLAKNVLIGTIIFHSALEMSCTEVWLCFVLFIPHVVFGFIKNKFPFNSLESVLLFTRPTELTKAGKQN